MKTASYLTKSGKIQKFTDEQFDKHQVLVEPEPHNPCNIWIVCEKSKMDNAIKELTTLINENKIESTICKVTPMKACFLKRYDSRIIKTMENDLNTQDVSVFECGNDSFEVTGTIVGRNEMLNYLKERAARIVYKVCICTITIVGSYFFYDVNIWYRGHADCLFYLAVRMQVS